MRLFRAKHSKLQKPQGERGQHTWRMELGVICVDKTHRKREIGSDEGEEVNGGRPCTLRPGLGGRV